MSMKGIISLYPLSNREKLPPGKGVKGVLKGYGSIESFITFYNLSYPFDRRCFFFVVYRFQQNNTL